MDDQTGSPTSSADRALAFFQDRFELDDSRLAAALDTALERKIDYADLYFEYTTTDSVSLEEGIVKSGDRHLEQGVGVRAVRGERQGYAHSDDISFESARLAAGTARAIADETREHAPVAITTQNPAHDLYPITTAPTDVPVTTKVDWLGEMDAYARSIDPKISQVMASIVSQHKHVLIAGSDGTRVADVLPLVRVNIQVLAADGQRKEIGYQGAGGRFELEDLRDPARWKKLVDEAVRIALLNLEAVACPAGAMDVVLAPGWPGILLHEAIGHGLEGDFNRKKTSAFSDKMGQRVAAEGVTVVDDGTLPKRRGSLNVDDEGTPTKRNVLIDNGVLVGYMQDRLNAKLMGVEPTGNGRRESYAHPPLPRMTNTFMLAGQDDPEDILRSVENGLYAVSFGGGQVDITSGKFVFSASEAYRIENGRIGAPVRGATLIGNGPDVLKRVSRIGHDLALDEGVGTCGKDGQGVPVGVGLPTIRLDGLTVGDRKLSPSNSREKLDLIVDHALDRAAHAGASQADVLLVEGDEREVRVRGGEVEFVKQAQERGLGIRVLVEGSGGLQTAIVSTSDLAQDAVSRMAAEAVALARATAADPHAGLPEGGFATEIPDLGLFDAADRSVALEARIEDAKRAEQAARDFDERIDNSEGSAASSGFATVHYGNSRGFRGSYESASHGLFSEPIARDGEGMQRDYWMTAGRRLSDLEDPASVGRKAAERALRRLGSKRVATCEVPVLFDSLTAPSLLGQLVSCLNGYAIYRESSFLAERMGEVIASPKITVIDDGRLTGHLGTKPFDGEGQATRRNVLVDQGRLDSWLLDHYSASKLGLESTGSASRGTGSAPRAGTTNLWIEPGEKTLDELVAEMDRGLLVTELIGMGFNPTTGDYSRGAAGLWIENGEVVHPVEEITIAGNLGDMLMQVDRVGSELVWRGRTASPPIRIESMMIAGE